MDRPFYTTLNPLEARGYSYGAVAPQYPFIPFLEPVLILAGIAFVAFLIQVLQALFVGSQPSNPSLVGGLVDSLVPTRHRTLPSLEDKQYKDLLDAIKVAKLIEEAKEQENEWMETSQKNAKGTPGVTTSERSIMLTAIKTPLKMK